MAVFTVVLYPLFLICLLHLPNIVGHPIVFEGKPLYYTSEFQGNKEKADEPDDVVVPQYKDVEETQNKKDTIAPRNMWERIWYNIKYSKGLNAITNGREKPFA